MHTDIGHHAQIIQHTNTQAYMHVGVSLIQKSGAYILHTKKPMTFGEMYEHADIMYYQLSFSDPTGGSHQIMKTQLSGKPLPCKQLIN